MDHFARLGLPAALDLEPASLDRAYFALQRQWHPDRFANRSPDERARASVEAAALNDAYRTLKDPLSRAVYLAELKGVTLPGDGRTIDDPELLMEAMEARERLSEVATIDELEKLQVEAGAKAIDLLSQLSKAFAADDLDAANKAATRMKYWRKFLEESRARRAALEDDE
jgi:molecular chaperone HscB